MRRKIALLAVVSIATIGTTFSGTIIRIPVPPGTTFCPLSLAPCSW